MARVRAKRRFRSEYKTKILDAGLFRCGVHGIIDEFKKSHYRISFLKKLHKRCHKHYDLLHEELDAYFKEHVRYLYRVNTGDKKELLWLDFDDHRVEIRRANRFTERQKWGGIVHRYDAPTIVFMYKASFEPNDWYKKKLARLDLYNRAGHQIFNRIKKYQEDWGIK